MLLTRADRQALERDQWMREAADYLVSLGVFEDIKDNRLWQLVDSLHHHSKDEGGEMMYTAKEAVDEELTYWGD
ncbi:hypothetical protein D3C80_448630 [compost metagenome]